MSENPSNEERSLNQIMVFCVMSSAVLGILYWLLRYGFEDNSFFDIFKVLSVAYFLLLIPYFFNKIRIKISGVARARWFYSPAFISVLNLFFLVFLGWASLMTGLKLVYFVFIASFSLLVLFLIEYFLYFFRKIDLAYWILFIFLAYLAAGLIWGYKYQSPLFFERIILGIAHKDTLTYSAISNMIKTYGVPSLGIDGLKYLHYHWGSSWIFAYLSGLINMDMIKFYNLGFPVIFIPFLFKSLLSFVVDLRRYSGAMLKMGPLVYLLLLLGYVKLGYSAVGNEGYFLATGFAFLLFSIVIYFLQDLKSRGKNGSLNEHLFLFLFLPLSILMVGAIKINIAFLLYGLFGYLFLRLKWYKNYKFFVSLVACFLTSIIVYLAFVYPEASRGMASPSYLVEYIRGWNLFFSWEYLWLWIFVILFFYKNRITTLGDLRRSFVQHSTLDLEILLVVAVLGLLPGAVMIIGGGSAWYFSSFQQILSLSLVLGYLGFFVNERKESWRSYAAGLRASTVLIIIFLCLSNLSLIYDSAKLSWDLIENYNFIIRRKMLNPSEPYISLKEYVVGSFRTAGWTGPLQAPAKYLKEVFEEKGVVGTIQSIKTAARSYQPALKEWRNYELIKTLEKISEMNLAEKRRTAVYIPRSNRIFWEMDVDKNNSACIRPLVVTAMTGLAMIDGLPEGEVATYAGNCAGYASYKYEQRLVIDENNSQSIKSAAEMRGFSQVIVIKQVDDYLIVQKL